MWALGVRLMGENLGSFNVAEAASDAQGCITLFSIRHVHVCRSYVLSEVVEQTRPWCI